MLKRLVIPLVAVAVLVQGSPLSTYVDYQHSTSQRSFLAPLHADTTEAVENSYIVVLKDALSQSAFDAHTNFVHNIHFEAQLSPRSLSGINGITDVYDNLIKGYAGYFAPETIDIIRTRPEVDFVEVNQYVYASNITHQRDAPWGLARISHREKLKFSTFRKYSHDPRGGEGVDVYVIDTGIHIGHAQFEGRAEWSKTMPKNDVDEDGNGHGTHCAGTIGSQKYGVAKQANLYAIKVLNSEGRGTNVEVIGGVSWAVEQAERKAAAAQDEFKKTGKTKHKGSVANMSLGGDKSLALDRAVNVAVTRGLHFAVAAGNDNKDACKFSPAAAENAVTVGASTVTDNRAYFSNHGECVDVFAPGLNILSTWIGGTDATNTISGTSMASPHVAGLIAYYLSLATEEKELLFREHGLSHLLSEAASYRLGFFGQLYAMVKMVLPGVLLEWLPSGQTASLQIPTISPDNMKRLLISLSTKDAITDLPPRTANYLVFNNATTS